MGDDPHSTTSASAKAKRPRLPDHCAEELTHLVTANRFRRMVPNEHRGKYVLVDGKAYLNLASNDYLAFAQDPHLIDAAIRATREHGVGTASSRLISGTHPIHTRVEQRFAAFKKAQACLFLPTGYTANIATLTTLAGPRDRVVLDKLVHASLIDAARASGAEVRTFPHLNLGRAARLLSDHRGGRRLLVTDSVFSMDGDCADLPSLCDLACRYNAVLIVDEAHGTGVLGSTGSGLAEHQGVAEQIYHAGLGGIVVSTASKALGALGGLITADKSVIDLIVNKARPFIYSTAPPPAQAASVDAAIDLLHDEPQRRDHLRKITSTLRQMLSDAGWRTDTIHPPIPIIPLVVGTEQAAIALAQRLRRDGLFTQAIRPPTVAPGQSRIRLTLRADMTIDDMARIAESVGPHPGA